MFELLRKKTDALSEPQSEPENNTPDEPAEEQGATNNAIPMDESVLAHALEDIQKDNDAAKYERKKIKNELHSYNQQTQRFVEIVENYEKRINELLRNNEKNLNRELERHVLYPAIETIALLADHIRQLDQEFQRITAKHHLCDRFDLLGQMLCQSVATVQQQMEHLDIRWITPCEFEVLDNQYHDIKNVVDVDDENLHKKIKHTLIVGLLYRGTVLRRAQVSVYRYEKRQPPSPKGEINEN